MLDSISCEYNGSSGRFEILKDSKIVLVGLRINELFLIKEMSMNHAALTVFNDMLTEGDLWNRRLSHISGKRLKLLLEQGILPKGVTEKLSFCEHCGSWQVYKTKFSKGLSHHTKAIIDYIHFDLWEPSQIPSLNNFKYFLTFTDETQDCQIYPSTKWCY